jgi:hypothetical protein
MAIASRKKSSFRAECNAAKNHEVFSEAKSIKIDLSPESSGLRFSRYDDTQRTKKPPDFTSGGFYISYLLLSSNPTKFIVYSRVFHSLGNT